MTKTFHGTVSGNSIEFDEDIGLAEGQQVEVYVKALPPKQEWGSGILRTAGALADDPFWDDIMEEVHRARKMGRSPQIEQ